MADESLDTKLMGNIKRNVIQSIRAFSAPYLQEIAPQLGHHFLFANLADVHTKQEVVESIVEQFTLAKDTIKSLDVLKLNLTDTLFKAGSQVGFIMVLEHIPVGAKFDRDIREQLLDCFREIADFWADKGVCCRVFYSFAVARSVKSVCRPVQAEDHDGEKMPTDKILDVSPLALRMSSPFNPDYWLTVS